MSQRQRINFTIATTRDAQNTLDLRYGYYPRDFNHCSRWVVFLNGRAEWIEKYSHLPKAFNLAEDVGFLTFDHRGQGASGGLKAYVDDYKTYASDLARVINSIVKDKPYVVVAHSMGGLISLYATLTGLVQPQKLALCSPLFGLPEKPLPTSVARPLAQILKRAKLGYVNVFGGKYERPPFEANYLTHDPEMYRMMKESPYPIPSPTVSWIDATFRASHVIFDGEALKNLRCPVLVLAGSEEKVVFKDAFQLWIQKAASSSTQDISFRWINGARHELLSETPEFFVQVIDFIKDFCNI